MKIFNLIEEIRKILLEEFEVITYEPTAVENMSVDLLSVVFPLLPSDVKLLLKTYKEYSRYSCHSDRPNCDWLFGSIRLLSGSETMRVFKRRMEIVKKAQLDDLRVIGPIKPGGVWREAWMPLTEGPKWFFACDMDPAVGGFIGQIIYISVEDGTAEFIFESITQMLEVQLGLLKSGERDIFEAEDYFYK